MAESTTPPDAGWVPFDGNSFTVDWSKFSLGSCYLYQRVSDGIASSVSLPLSISVVSAPPSLGNPIGPTSVNCSTDAQYSFTVSDCNAGETVSVSWYLSSDPSTPTGGQWTSISGTIFHVLYNSVPNGTWYLFLRASDRTKEVMTNPPLTIQKTNSPPDKPLTPSGPNVITCEQNVVTYYFGQAERFRRRSGHALLGNQRIRPALDLE